MTSPPEISPAFAPCILTHNHTTLSPFQGDPLLRVHPGLKPRAILLDYFMVKRLGGHRPPITFHLSPFTSHLSHNNPVPQPSVDEGTHHISGIECVRKSEIDLAGFVKERDLFGSERYGQTGDVVFQLSEFTCSDNRDDRDRAISQPGDGDLGFAAPGLFADILEGLNDASSPVFVC